MHSQYIAPGFGCWRKAPSDSDNGELLQFLQSMLIINWHTHLLIMHVIYAPLANSFCALILLITFIAFTYLGLFLFFLLVNDEMCKTYL